MQDKHNQGPSFDKLVFVGNPKTTQRQHMEERKASLLNGLDLMTSDMDEIYDFPTAEMFDQSITDNSLVAFYSGDGGQRHGVEALVNSHPETASRATVALLRAGNGCNGALDTAMPSNPDNILKQARVEKLHLLKYSFIDSNDQVIDQGVGLTCLNIGISGQAGDYLERSKPQTRLLGRARILPELAILMAAAYQQTPYRITLPNGQKRLTATTDIFNSSYIAKARVDRANRFGLTSPNVMVYSPACSEDKSTRNLQITEGMARMALGLSGGAIRDLGKASLDFQIETNQSVLGGVDGEHAPHNRAIQLEDGARVSVSQHPAKLKILSRRKK